MNLMQWQVDDALIGRMRGYDPQETDYEPNFQSQPSICAYVFEEERIKMLKTYNWFQCLLYACLRCNKLYCLTCVDPLKHNCICDYCERTVKNSYWGPYGEEVDEEDEEERWINGQHHTQRLNGRYYVCSRHCAERIVDREARNAANQDAPAPAVPAVRPSVELEWNLNTRDDLNSRNCMQLTGAYDIMLRITFQNLYCYKESDVQNIYTRRKHTLLIETKLFQIGSPSHCVMLSYLGTEDLETLPVKVTIEEYSPVFGKSEDEFPFQETRQLWNFDQEGYERGTITHVCMYIYLYVCIFIYVCMYVCVYVRRFGIVYYSLSQRVTINLL